MRRVVALCSIVLIAVGCSSGERGQAEAVRQAGYDRRLKTVATFDEQMPTGVAVSSKGRIFVCFPRWEDPVRYTVAEVKDGVAVPYPGDFVNQGQTPDQLVSVQSVVVDPQDRLWLLDTGSVNFGPVQPRAAKLVGIDLKTDRVFKTVHFSEDVVLPTTYLNDVRFDLRWGRELAFITDSSVKGPNAIIVVDLQHDRAWRKLDGHWSTQPDADFSAAVEGRTVEKRPAPGQVEPFAIGSDGIAITEDRLFFCPLTSRRLHAVSLDALVDEDKTDEQVAATLETWQREFASDGLESDAEGKIYLTDWEHGAVRTFDPHAEENARFQTLVKTPDLLWPDTLCLARDGRLYITASQLHRQPSFHEGRDLRQRPFRLFAIDVNERPAALK
jgi:sugar lactone lactonase YvrE